VVTMTNVKRHNTTGLREFIELGKWAGHAARTAGKRSTEGCFVVVCGAVLFGACVWCRLSGRMTET